MKKDDTVMGVRADAPRLTIQAAFLLACVLSTPFILLLLLDLVWL